MSLIALTRGHVVVVVVKVANKLAGADRGVECVSIERRWRFRSGLEGLVGQARQLYRMQTSEWFSRAACHVTMLIAPARRVCIGNKSNDKKKTHRIFARERFLSYRRDDICNFGRVVRVTNDESAAYQGWAISRSGGVATTIRVKTHVYSPAWRVNDENLSVVLT